MGEHEPVIIITTSRGGSTDWEIERVEGGHGGSGNAAWDWSSDGFEEAYPTQDSIREQSWSAINTWRDGNTLTTKLPVDAILEATKALELHDVEIEVDETGTSGNYLSGFLGLHGLAYAEAYPEVLAAGHIHVGQSLPTDEAQKLMEATLRAVLTAHPPDPQACSVD